MGKISIPKRPTTNTSTKEVIDDATKPTRKSNGKRSGTGNAKLVGSKSNVHTTKAPAKKTRKVDTEKKETKEKSTKVQRSVKEEFDVTKVLPEGYIPEVYKFGKNEGYVFLPRNIFDWITTYSNDWHKRINDFPFYRDMDIIHSLLYYILKDGYVYVQENRYSKFYQIKISEE